MATELQVLLIEDADTDAVVFGKVLQDLEAECPVSYVLNRATSIAEARDRLVCSDLIICDLTLPDSQPATTYELFLSQPSSAPVLVWTGLDDPQMMFRAGLAGIHTYVLKTRDPANIKSALMCALGLAEARRRTKAAQAELRQSLMQQLREIGSDGEGAS